MEFIKVFFEWSATAIEVGTVLLLVVATTFGTAVYVLRFGRHGEGAYREYKVRLGKMLILALEFMVTADIIRTVALDQTLNNVLILGLLVMIRTFLSWSLSVEIEGHWPWQGGAKLETEETGK
jgi:uncharacterized membrane protein